GQLGGAWLNGPHPFSADGRWLGTIRRAPNPFAKVPGQPKSREELQVLDSRTGNVALWRVLNGARDLAVSSAWVACGDGQAVVFYDLASGRRTGDIEAGQPLVALSCDAPGTRLLAGLGPNHLGAPAAPARAGRTGASGQHRGVGGGGQESAVHDPGPGGGTPLPPAVQPGRVTPGDHADEALQRARRREAPRGDHRP